MTGFGLGPEAWLVAIVAVVVGATIQGAVGLGFGLVAGPVLVLLDPTLMPGTALGMSIPVGIVIAWRERHDIDLSLLSWAMVGRVPGSVAGSLAVVAIGTRSLSIVFAVLILVAVAVSLRGLPVRRTGTTMLTAGFLSGMTGTATSVGGPPMALVLQDQTGPQLRSAMASFLTFGALLSIAVLAAVGRFGSRELSVTGLLTPAALVGLLLSKPAIPIIDRGYTRPAVLGTATVAALAILVREL